MEIVRAAVEAANPVSMAGGQKLEVRIVRGVLSDGHAFKVDVAFTLAPGISILFGASGAGKTTILDCIAGLVAPDSGRIAVGDQALFDSERQANISPERRKTGYVLQDLALFPHLTAEQNIGYGLSKLTSGERRDRVDAILRSFHIVHLRRRKPREISGGERQRVALARTLVIDPCALLLDEPLAALDSPTKSKIIDDLRNWNEAHRVPILYVTHSREEVFALGERVLILEKGQLIADGTPHQVMTVPRRETEASLAGLENIFDARVVAVHEDRGTMTCQLAGSGVELETPLVKAEVGSGVRIGIQAGDVLLATSLPEGLSARNVIAGKMISFRQRDVIVIARVDCGVEMEVHLTLAARDALRLQRNQPVWLIVKTHSCHLMRG